MCGIAGIVEAQLSPSRKLAVARMCQIQTHRGPDGEGLWNDDMAALGHRRLAIIDLNNSAAQPMIGQSGAVISFNGEIYNYKELRKEMEEAGEHFRSNSDTEVLLRLFEREGENCLNKLVGMFAFAIWDARKQKLFLARDRLGKKPLYYWHQKGCIAFASEIKALLTLPEIAVAAKPNPFAMSDFLSLGYILTPKTAFSNIQRLPAAHYAWFNPVTDHLSFHEYWQLEEYYLDKRINYNSEAQERFLELITEAVRIRLQSDVPVGVFLSGGMDSSAIAQIIAGFGSNDVQAFCVSFKDKSFDESIYAQKVAQHIGIPLTILSNPSPNAELISELIWHCDEPFADTSIMPTYLLNKSARKHITVALTGDGADEILAGYPTHRANAIYRLSHRLPHLITRNLSRLADASLKPRYHKVGWDFKVRQFLRGHGLAPEKAHYFWRVIMSDREKHNLMGMEMLQATADYSPFENFAEFFKRVKGASFLDQTLYVDTKTWLQDDILVKADRMSMAASLELRSPFLDHRLVEFAARLAPSGKMNLRRQKIILKDIMKSKLPNTIINRRKSGFSAPTRDLQRISLSHIEAGNLFQDNFHLDHHKEDITFKSFLLATLGAWLHLMNLYQKTGKWDKSA